MDSKIIDSVNNLLRTGFKEKACITLDWLSMYLVSNQPLKFAELAEGEAVTINHNTYLLYLGDTPRGGYRHSFEIFYNKERAGYILFEPMKGKKIAHENVCKVEFGNALLYNADWYSVYSALVGYGFSLKTFGRVDIAIDGMRHIHELLNIYAKQTLLNKTIFLKNSSPRRAMFGANAHNPRTLCYENFTVGKNTGRKKITLYNKTLEIGKSGKQYIIDYWLKNNVISQEQHSAIMVAISALPKKKKLLEEIVDLPDAPQIYRLELRLKAEAMNEIKDVKVQDLLRASTLASIVKIHTKKFFDFHWYNDKANVSRCERIEVLPLDQFNARTLEKTPRKATDGKYKAKMTMHGLLADLYKGTIPEEEETKAEATIVQRMESYELSGYLLNKIDEWDRKYWPAVDENRRNKVSMIKHRITRAAAAIVHDYYKALATRHRQANATAQFGE